jgi:glucose-6-phosphate 1-dehydrogenase
VAASVPTDAPPEQVGDNPLVEGLERLPVAPTTMVIFGASGDLAARKLLPALYNLAHEGALPERFNLIGAARREQTTDEFREVARESISSNSRRAPDGQVLDGLLERMHYVSVPFDDGEAYAELGKLLERLDEDAGQPLARMYYLSTAPEYFPIIAEQLKEAGLHRHREADIRVVIEKPFGTDLESARRLQEVVSSVFRERQVFRIDHYLGKETVQNLLAFRFANLMFEPVWNRNYIDHVQITAAEDIGIGSRAGYYDSSGALRDLVQNHMLQLLTLLCMEPPSSFDADKVRDEKVKVLDAIRPPTPEEVAAMTVRAQYAAGSPGGEDVPGYLDEDGVPDESQTETYAALRLEVQDDGDRGPAQAGPAPRVRLRRLGRRAAEPADPRGAAERGRVAVAGGQDPRLAHADPAGEHGVPLRLLVHVAVARGLRAPHPGCDARRGDTLHARRRGDRAVVDHRSDPQGVAGGSAAEGRVRGRLARAAAGGRADRSAQVARALT